MSKIGDRVKRQEGNPGGEGSDRSAVSSQSGPAITVGDGTGRNVKVDVGTDDPQPVDSRSASHSAVDIGHDQGGTDDQASGGEINQKNLHPHSHAHVEKRSSREGGDVAGKRAGKVNSPARSEPDTMKRTPAPPTSQGGGSQSTSTTSFLLSALTDDADNPVVPDPVHVGATTPKDKSDWKHTASSGAKLLLRTVERSSDVFPPLKSVVAGLCAILDNCEVCSAVLC